MDGSAQPPPYDHIAAGDNLATRIHIPQHRNMPMVPDDLARSHRPPGKRGLATLLALGTASQRPRSDSDRAGGVAALARGRGERLGPDTMLAHQLQQRRQLLFGQRALADIHHDLRAMKEIRALAELPAQRVQY